jgi:ferredoxin
MKFKIKSELCRGCGVCEAVCPHVYQMDSSRVAKVVTESVSVDLIECAMHGEEVCPVRAIIHN